MMNEEMEIRKIIFDKGKDAALNGADRENSHYSIFGSVESMKLWQEGYQEGVREKTKQ